MKFATRDQYGNKALWTLDTDSEVEAMLQVNQYYELLGQDSVVVTLLRLV